MIRPLVSHLARIGGVLVSPRATLRRALWSGEASLWEVLPWMVVVTAAVAPTGAGRALLLGRVAALDGVLLFFNLVAGRMIGPLLGVLIAAALLAFASRMSGGEPRVSFDVALDALGLTLVPFLALAAVGSLLSSVGVEVSVLPHRRLTVPGALGGLRFVVAFGWPLALYGFLLIEVWTRRGAPAPEPADG